MGMVAFYNRRSTRFKVAYLTEIKSVSGFKRAQKKTTMKKKKMLDSAAVAFFRLEADGQNDGHYSNYCLQKMEEAVVGGQMKIDEQQCTLT